jgi:DNA polymerase-3 subunit epsilon
MREVVLDTETTGLDPNDGHRIVEIGALELINHLPSGRVFHAYLNPDRDIPAEALAVHGLTSAFLRDQPSFADVAKDFLAFLDSDRDANPAPAGLVIHNADFDLPFINSELVRLGLPALGPERSIIDTLSLARTRFPGAPNSLDALCRRFAIDGSARLRHGALLDAELLAECYLGLVGGRQPDLGLVVVSARRTVLRIRERPPRPARPHAPTPEELAAHAAFLALIKDAVWLA